MGTTGITISSTENSTGDHRKKLAILRAATHHSFPTADIDHMLQEIEQGHSSNLPT